MSLVLRKNLPEVVWLQGFAMKRVCPEVRGGMSLWVPSGAKAEGNTGPRCRRNLSLCPRLQMGVIFLKLI